MPTRTPTYVPADSPSRNDSVLKRLPRLVGPVGRHTVPGRTGGSFFTPLRVLILLTTLSAIIAVLLKSACRVNGWGAPDVFFAGCYSDWTALYSGRGLAETPFAPFAEGSTFEYPVLMSLVAALAAAVARVLPGHEANPSLVYFDVNFLAVTILWMITVVVTAKSVGRRPWDAAMVAVAPGIMLAGSINWDLWAVALLAVGLWLWGGNKPVWAGVFFGLGAAMKVFPLLVFGALLILAIRTLRFTPLLKAAAAAAGAWLAVNLPLMIANFEAWQVFYTFSSERPPGWSSVWNVWNVYFVDTAANITGETLSLLAFGSFAVCCALIFLFGVTLQHRPRLAQLTLLIVAAFVLCNKVYSPQFVVWLIPLVALALPNWRDYLIWQFFEVLHFWAIWAYLSNQSSGHETPHSFDENIYVLAVLGHVAATVYIMGRVIYQMRHPKTDPVRRSLPAQPTRSLNPDLPVGTPELNTATWNPEDLTRLPVDDPIGGPYDGEPDRAPWLSGSGKGRRARSQASQHEDRPQQNKTTATAGVSSTAPHDHSEDQPG